MRVLSVCLVAALFVAMLLGVSGNPVGDDIIVTLEAAEQPLSLLDVEAQQGHENVGDRLARHHHGYGGYGGWGGRGGYGGYGGYGGGYGGWGGGFGGWGGRGGWGGWGGRGGYGGYGGYWR